MHCITLKLSLLTLCTALTLGLTGCAVLLPFNEPQLRSEAIAEIRQAVPQQDIKLHVVWEPASFVNFLEIKGADGFSGHKSSTHIPTGSGLSGRIEQALQEVFIIDENAEPLVIRVEHAQSNFEYSVSAGLKLNNLIDKADIIFKADFTFGDLSWSGEYSAHRYDPSYFADNSTLIMEQAWDDIAVQVAKDAAAHLKAAAGQTN